MLTTNELREQLAADVESAPLNVDRTSQVRRRVTLHRRRRAVGTGVASLALLAVAAVVLVPQLDDRSHTVPPAGPSPSASADTPLPQYHLGGVLIAEAERVGSGPFTVPFDTSDPRKLMVTLDCYVPGAGTGNGNGVDGYTMVTFSVGGVAIGAMSCDGTNQFTGGSTYGPADESLAGLLAGQQTLTVAFEKPVPATSRLRVGLYETVPLDTYQFPPAPDPLPSLDLYGNLMPSEHRHPIALLSAGPLTDETSVPEIVGSQGTWTRTVTLDRGLRMEGQTVAPGMVTIQVNGQEVGSFSGWDYSNAGWQATKSLKELGISAGDPVTITVTAERFTGDSWALLLADEH